MEPSIEDKRLGLLDKLGEVLQNTLAGLHYCEGDGFCVYLDTAQDIERLPKEFMGIPVRGFVIDSMAVYGE